MKTILLIAVLSMPVVLRAEEEVKPPLELQLLQEKRKDAIQKIDITYRRELEKLLSTYTKRGDLDAANAVAVILKELKSTSANEPTGRKPTVLELANGLDGKWRFDYYGKDSLRRFKGNKMIDEHGATHQWKFEDGGITIDWEPGVFEKLTLDPKNPDVMNGTNYAGKKFTYTRIKE